MAHSHVSKEPLVRRDPDPQHAMALFPRDVVSVASARHWLAGFLAAHQVKSSVTADATLVLSELVTNALRHGMGEVATVGSLDDDQVRVSVIDCGDELPKVAPAEPGRIGGLGLHVIGRVADEWGVAPFPGGKTVWATLSRHRP
jgi:anti-sigma regulatory factor (Ser/Thr protein kinase)